jgi:hypothetical protein
MSIESVTDLTLDTCTSLPCDFICTSQILILSPHLTELPIWFLYENVNVKTLDMSRCTKITIIPDYFCVRSYIEHIIWPPNIKIIQCDCLTDNIYIRKIDLSYCNQLTYISGSFCKNTNITDIALPISIQIIEYEFCKNNKTLMYLDFSFCIKLTNIGFSLCDSTNIRNIIFPKSLQTILGGICFNSDIQELDFSKCKDIYISAFGICKVKILKIYSIDSITKKCKINCENIYIYNITETKYLDLTDIEGLQTVHLPKGEYCITNITSKDYSNVKFWLGDKELSAKDFSELKWYSYQSLPIHDLVVLDTPLETV